MKAEFKFEPGDIVKSKNGLIAPITHCAVSAKGIMYLQRGIYTEQWAAEEDLEKSEVPKPQRLPEQKKKAPAKNRR
jgi:hypothetical protein